MSTSRNAENMEDSVKDSIRMLYEDAPPKQYQAFNVVCLWSK